jgi:hypothetical protein
VEQNNISQTRRHGLAGGRSPATPSRARSQRPSIAMLGPEDAPDRRWRRAAPLDASAATRPLHSFLTSVRPLRPRRRQWRTSCSDARSARSAAAVSRLRRPALLMRPYCATPSPGLTDAQIETEVAVELLRFAEPADVADEDPGRRDGVDADDGQGALSGPGRSQGAASY